MLNSVSSIDLSLDKISGPSTVTTAVRGPAPISGTPAIDFTNVLAQVSANAVTDLKTGEAAAISGMTGKLSVQEVVEAVMSAEKTLQTALAVRDKVVAAYQEISRMAI
jgi:flagellar hook-basal body complex protein FliE